uniref:Uncharacterized protein n=1 Tax=Kuenenia stuttgartiensis TaxID=174633 RepID=Q1PXZ3_KUEST|nr:unknown protein [Candidatus Kuenenia stuttgartiensis]
MKKAGVAKLFRCFFIPECILRKNFDSFVFPLGVLNNQLCLP